MGRWTIVFLLSLSLLFAVAGVQAAAPALREQISLNGTWSQGGNVPHYVSQNSSFDTKTYERSVTVPANFSGKRIQLEFNAVNWYCDVYINNTKIGSHTGAWVPFEFDITNRVSAGQTFTLRLEVKGMLQTPTQQNGKILWWIGHNELDKKRAGIVDDVWLRAYGQVHIEDTFVQTSFRNNQIKVDYTLRNLSGTSWTGRVNSDIIRESSNQVEKTLQTSDVTLAAGETKTVSVTSSWTNAALWWPDQPNLYHLKSTLNGGGRTDTETRRFGFREFWIEGNQFRLNGIRINIRGDWSCYSQYWGEIPNANVLREKYLAMQKTNANMLRWHKHPAPRFAYDMADEMGIMIMNESPFYGRPHYNHDQKTQLVDNCVTLIPAWIKAARNHASVMMWSACNEATYAGLSNIPAAQLKRLGDAIYALDTTRPVNYDGDHTVPGVMLNRHYPEGYEKDPTGNCYDSWLKYLDANKPVYFGEILAVRPGVNNNDWWIGVWPRGLRHNGFAGIAPRVFYDGGRITDAQEKLQANAYNPVALFDIAYDKLGITPFRDNARPNLDEGSWITRRVVLYNDDYRNTSVTAEVELYVDGASYAKGSKTFSLQLGEKKEFDIRFQAPFQGGKILDVVLRTYKNSAKKFEEAKRFNLIDKGTSGSSSNVVTVDGGTPPNQSPNVSLTSPINGSAYTAPGSITLNATATDSDGTISKVEFYANSTLLYSDSSAPFTFNWTNLSTGTYAITAKAFDNDGATKTSSAVNLTVNNAPPAIRVTGLTLINADTDADIGALNNGMTINLASLGTNRLAIRANTEPATVGSVRIVYDNTNTTTQNGAPYSYPTDNAGDYAAWTPTVGAHTFTATPFSAGNGGGTAGATLTVNFNVVDNLPFAVEITNVASGKSYVLANAKTGTPQYTDRTYTITSLSANLNGGILLRQANDDKLRSGSSELTFKVNAAAVVYICYDKRFTALPAFLNDGTWTRTTDTLSTTDTPASAMVVYKKNISTGSVTLGGNRQAPAAGAWTHYVPIVKPATSASRDLGEEAIELMALPETVAWAHPGDSDGDGLFDDYELGEGLDPFSVDSNGDGVSDEDELLSGGTLRHFELQHGLNAGGGAAPVNTQPFTLTKIAGAVKLNASGKDTVAVSGILTLPAGWDASGQTIRVDIGGAAGEWTLDTKAKSKSDFGSIALKFKRTRDKATKTSSFAGGNVSFTAKLRGDFADDWNEESVGIGNAKNDPLTIKVVVILNGTSFETLASAKHSSKNGTSGVFKGK